MLISIDMQYTQSQKYKLCNNALFKFTAYSNLQFNLLLIEACKKSQILNGQALRSHFLESCEHDVLL